MRQAGRQEVGDQPEIRQDTRPITHDTLDELPTNKTLEHLRSVLVATGAPPERDERLTVLERWINAALATRPDPDERRILHSYAIWHHLRRLRQRLHGSHASHLQCLNIRRHARGLSFPAIRWQGPTGPHDSEKRWDDAARLLQDDTLKTADRVVGLLLLLYAQNLGTISRLTADHINDSGEHVTLQLGSSPVAIPEPLADLVLELVEHRRGNTILDKTAATPWLFPGRRHGQPLSPGYLGQHLKNIGIHPGRGRSTALFALAAELPAAILARMLGIHISVAVQWQRASSGDWTKYAADISRRPSSTPP